MVKVANMGVVVTKDSGAGETIGDTTDAAVSTDANGSISAKLRGLIVLVVTLLSRWPASLGRKAEGLALAVVLSTEDLAKLEAIRALLAALPLPTGAATETTLAAVNTKLGSALPLPTGASSAANQATEITRLDSLLAVLGTITDPAYDSNTNGSIDGRLRALANYIENRLPVSVGPKTKSASLSVVGASDEGKYGAAAHTLAGVIATTAAALPSNDNALYRLFVNDSSSTIYLGLGTAAVVGRGIRLNANGGAYEMSKQLGNLYTGAVNAIHGGPGTANLLVTEGA
jgi:hypothetical protein